MRKRSKYQVEIKVFNGVEYRRYVDSPLRSDRLYFQCSSTHFKRGLRYLHRDIWASINGPVPDGYHVHHKDGDTLNNDPGNLVLKQRAKHLSEHSSTSEWVGSKKHIEHLESIRSLASEWHKSEEGRRWHREVLAPLGHAARASRVAICECCGMEYQSKNVKSRFCSNKCKSKHRRDSRVDNIVKQCKWCGKDFESNKYEDNEFCSKSCSRTAVCKAKRDSSGL